MGDLIAIGDYLAIDSPAQSAAFGELIERKVGSLAHYPFLGRLGRTPGTRELVVHKYYIAIYRVRGATVEILRLKHAARAGA